MTVTKLTAVSFVMTDATEISLSDEEAVVAFQNFMNGKPFSAVNDDEETVIYPPQSVFSVKPTYTTTEEEAPADDFCEED